jgi:hypothetical protein
MTDEKKEAKKNTPSKGDFAGYQLNLFRDFLFNSDTDKDKLSNTIELWDAAPKYFMGRKKQITLRENGTFLPTLERGFVYKKQEYTIKITPARIFDKKTRKEIEYYPAAREELVEDALRKLALLDGFGFANQSRSGVAFTLHQLKKELSAQGHTMSYKQVTESLEILTSCKVEIAPLNGKAICLTSPLTSLVGVSKDDLKNDPDSRWRVDFSLLVTKAINTLNYRQFNYIQMMGHKSQLSRYLIKRLAHNFTQASMGKQYTLKMSTIARDSCLLDCERQNDNKRKIEGVFKELIANNVLMMFEEIETRGSKNSLVDVTYKLYPHIEFVTEVKRANKRAQTEGPI